MADVFDKFVDGTKQAFEAVADAATDLFEKGKVYVSVRQLESRLRDAYRALGRLQYRIETEGGADGEEKAKLVAAIGGLIDEIAKASVRPPETDSQEFVACAACGAMIPKTANFCGGCGAKAE